MFLGIPPPHYAARSTSAAEASPGFYYFRAAMPKRGDGSGILEGAGKKLRYVTLRTPADAARAAVKRLVRNAFRLGAGKPSRWGNRTERDRS